MKHLLTLEDLTKNEILSILNLADQLKFQRNNHISHKLLEGKTLGMIFQKSSTRTRVSFEVGMYELGGNALFLSSRDLQIGRGEPVEDTARVLSRYLDAIMIRTFKQQEVEDLAKYGSVPVINALTDYAHPCQVLADLMTIREYKGDFTNLNICYIGDGNNMANSIIVGCLKLGMNVRIACPKGYYPAERVLNFTKDYKDHFFLTNDPKEAAKDADVFFTDVYTSMGQEAEREIRAKAFKGYQINDEVIALAHKNCMVQHCLPAHREEEITAKVFESHAKEIFDEAENRLHAQKAVLVKLLSE